ncbi:MAG TPA: bifunctional diguanylate cyclase/phosphodiesterase [Thermoleophilaceae bacterium]|nr:bifunctional diguanylate cyclase/phosphodiesterase [Thermoleophilaceae bacterium]
MRLGFHGRLLGALVLTLIGLGALQYFVLSADTRDRLYDEEGQTQRADAAALSRAYTITVPGEVPLNNVNRYLRAITARPGSDDASLVDGKGLLLAGGTTLGIGLPDKDKHVAQVLRSGRQYVGPADDYDSKDGHIIAVTPVKGIPGGKHALVARQEKEVLGSRLADIRRLFLLLGIGGALLAIPAFYFFGGRSLSRLHRAAVQRATLDGLTDLPNHRAFQDELERQVSQARRHQQELTLVLVDIDDFRFHNDTYGHSHADRTLRQMADSLAAGRAEDIAFRIGGDEFALLLPHTGGDAGHMAVQGVRDRLAGQAGVAFSAGLASFGPKTEDADSLVNQADVALQEAKRRGGAETVRFGDVEGASVVTAAKTRAVRRLLADAEMDAAYQPIWHADTSGVLGYEGLARPAPDRGINGPGEAFDVAGSIGRSAELDDLCRRAVLTGAADLPEDALLFVNVAPQSLDGQRLAGDQLADEARAAGLEPERIVLEITERFDGRIDRIVAEAARLRALGFKIALDDVGAGNSGLQMMRELELDFVKIDRMVLVRAVTDITARAVLVSVIAFARETGAFVIAEGIEDDEMLALARWPRPAEAELLGAQGVQGFLLGRPGALPDAPEPPRTEAERVLGSL